MGLSASQGRLLSLTARLSDLEYRAQVISNDKIRLADKSEAVSKSYLDALSAKKLTVYNPAINSQVDASLVSLYQMNDASTGNGKKRVVVDVEGNMVIANSKYTSAMASKEAYNSKVSAVQAYGLEVTADTSASEIKSMYESMIMSLSLPVEEGGHNNCYETGDTIPTDINGVKTSLENLEKTANNGVNPGQAVTIEQYSSASSSKVLKQAYLYQAIMALQNLYTSRTSYESLTASFNMTANTKEGKADNYVAKGVVACPAGYETDTEYLYTQLSNGNWFIVEYDVEGGADGTGAWETISWSSGDAQLQTVADEGELARAEAEYETAMSQIQAKDKKFDLELKTIDAEHSAVQQEVDSVNKVMNKNIERTFKIFS